MNFAEGYAHELLKRFFGHAELVRETERER
jgi:hypothetical protein